MEKIESGEFNFYFLFYFGVFLQGDLRNKDDLEKLFSRTK
jgi:hypothetical protein